jgi:hypothetical protein
VIAAVEVRLMSHVLVRATGGTVSLPDPATLMIDRADGGQLVLHPPRRVWDRTALTRDELVVWHLLIAATARAMLETLPQLDGGCLNYWDAGNWALNPAADPPGPKTAREHRVLHQHLCGRSPRSADPSWTWGESPFFPRYADRLAWSAGKVALTAAECAAIVRRAVEVLRESYDEAGAQGIDSTACGTCGYPTPRGDLEDRACPGCRAGHRP